MPWPVYPHGFLGAQGDSDTYRIERSLRFNSADSAYLNRTPASAGNRKTWTLSFWAKRSGFSSDGYVFGTAQAPSGTLGTYIGFASNTFLFGDYGASSWEWVLATTAVFRDPSSWYHFVVQLDTTQSTSTERVKLYVNGERITSFDGGSSYPTQNFDGRFNQAIATAIGRLGTFNGNYFDGYLTEIHFIDGQALTPSSFGETDAITGRWKAKAYSGTYGTNGFYLSFKNNGNVSALGTDQAYADGKKAENNFWTVNNFSVTAGAGNDSLVDSPTNYGTDTGVGGEVRGNYATLNVVDRNSSISLVGNGNLEFTQNSNPSTGIRRSTIGITSGKWYFEATPANVTAFSTQHTIGIIGDDHNLANYVGSGANGYAYRPDGNKLNNSAATSYGTTTTSNTDVIMVAFDANNWKIWFGKNGTWFASGDPVAGTNSAFSSITGGLYYFAVGSQHTGTGSATWVTNFGQRPFAYAAPAGFKALCTTNLPTPTIQKPSKYMDVVTYTGNGSTQTISGLNFSPDLVWLKSRSSASWWHILVDSVRGAGRTLSSNVTNAEIGSGSDIVSSLNSNGFSLNVSPNATGNENGTTYVAWAWDEAPIAGMDIVSYTGNGTNRTIAHNLGVAPAMMIVKRRDNVGAWFVYHQSQGATKYMTIDTAAAATSAAAWNNTAPSSSVFTVGTDNNVNGTSGTYIAYLFAEVEGFSKFGSYTGNGSADGPFVWCGFRPRWILLKESSASGNNWSIYDTARDSSNPLALQLKASTSDAEGSNTFADYTSNGFKIRVSTLGINSSGQTYVFAAFAESPFKYARAR